MSTITNPESVGAFEPVLPAIQFRSELHRGPKRFWRGTQRSISPDETLKRIQPFFRTAGLTRIANITGLDWIGVPVTLAIRPNARSLTTSSGKGFFLEAAVASGAMEAIELFHAEEAPLETFRMPYEQLPRGRIPIEGLPLTKHSLFNIHQPYSWTWGWDLINHEEVAVPRWMVHLCPDRNHTRDLRSFQVTSNGLASGNTLLEAINAGLFEVIERDAITCHRMAWETLGVSPPVVDLKAISFPLVLDLLERIERAGASLVLFDCMTDTAVPVYMAYLWDRRVPEIGTYRGYGAHLDPEIAMVRAITEVVQGRCIYIAGSRDDVFRHNYYRMHRHATHVAASMGLLVPDSGALQVPKNEATPTFEGDTLLALEKLKAVGLHQAIVLDLTFPELAAKVVKVVVPGLEGYLFDFYTCGPRAKAFLKARELS